jgi:hypothetical protein
MKKKIQLLFVTDGIFPHAIGGMQRHSALLIDALAKTGEVEIIVVHPHQDKIFNDQPSIQGYKSRLNLRDSALKNAMSIQN